MTSHDLTTGDDDPSSLALVRRGADLVASDVGLRQGDTIHGIRGLEDQRRGMASKKYMPRLEMEDGE